jgi:hypothetical protein
MIVSKSQKLDLGNPVELRIKKSEDLRQSICSLQSLFAQYTAQVKLLSAVEVKIARELEFFYSGQNVYTEFINRFTSALKFRDELFRKEMAALEKDLGSVKNYERGYENLTPYVKKYFKSSDALGHYEAKVPKIIDANELRRKQEGKVADSDAKKLMRNQKKLEDARIGTLVATNNLVDLSNKLNLERFDRINAVVSRFIMSQINLAESMASKLSVVADFDSVLKQKETTEFNNKFFIDLDPKQIDRMTRSHYIPSMNLDNPKPNLEYKQNIQNNYYVMNDRNLSPNNNSNPTYASSYQNIRGGSQPVRQQVTMKDLSPEMRERIEQAKEMNLPRNDQPIPMPYYK